LKPSASLLAKWTDNSSKLFQIHVATKPSRRDLLNEAPLCRDSNIMNDPPGVLDQVSRLIKRQLVVELSDTELLDRFVREKDAVAFETIMRRHGPLVLRVARRVLGREQDAEDVFQATFLVFSRKAGSLRKKETLGFWLCGVASRVALRARAKARRRAAHEVAIATRAAEAAQEEPVISEAEAALEEELSRLPEKYRSVLVLSYVQGLTRDEAARQLGLTPANVKKRLERGRALLQSRLARRGVVLSSALLGMMLTTDGIAAVPPALIASTVSAGIALAAQQSLVAAGVSAAVVSLVKMDAPPLFGAKFLLATVALSVLALAILAGGLALDSWGTQTGPVAVRNPQRDSTSAAYADLDVPPSMPPGSPLALRLVPKRTTYPLDFKGLSREEYCTSLRPGIECPSAPEVDLSLRVTNFGRQNLRLRMRGSANHYGWHLQGPGVVFVPQIRASAVGRRELPEEVTLNPSQTITLLDVSSLTSWGALGGNAGKPNVAAFSASRTAYWTSPGEYTLAAEYKLWISPAPPGAVVDGDGFGAVTLRSPKIHLQVEDLK
jgi:RNA polymerase sigma-70 factor (ECF subfamily)